MGVATYSSEIINLEPQDKNADVSIFLKKIRFDFLRIRPYIQKSKAFIKIFKLNGKRQTPRVKEAILIH